MNEWRKISVHRLDWMLHSAPRRVRWHWAKKRATSRGMVLRGAGGRRWEFKIQGKCFVRKAEK